MQIQSGNWVVPSQLLVRSPKDKIEVINGINIYSLASTVKNIGEDIYMRKAIDARTCLYSIQDSSELLSILLEGGHTVKAGRVAGAFRNIGNSKITEEILSTMSSTGYDVRETDPFAEIDEKYVSDAYHSLSIEDYKVTDDLINKVRSGAWDPKGDEDNMKPKNALAARGYWMCFQKVKQGVAEVFRGEDPGEVADKRHEEWYRELFSASVSAGILKPSDLAGYRNAQVYISGSMHTPPSKESVRDAMPVLFELLSQEENAAVRAILEHLIFVYIHPYMDGNGRIARFLMNLMLASGGYSWLIIPVEKRIEYMEALEAGSLRQDITIFTKFIASLIEEDQPNYS